MAAVVQDQPKASAKARRESGGGSSRGIYLQWEGKKVYRQRIPTPRLLEPVTGLSCGKDSANLIIEGDNLQVLASLKAQFGASVKLIYADPPYNTGNKDFRYSDRRFHDPDADDSDSVYVTNEDGGRHTKWLNDMAPRLWMLKDLLRSDGAIMVSIGDDEVFRLGMLMDEIFDEKNRIAVFIWQKHHSRNNTAQHISISHDYILMYAKSKANLKIRQVEFEPQDFTNPDNDPNGPWVSRDLSANHFYAAGSYRVKSPAGKVFGPTKGRYWSLSEENFHDFDKVQKRIWWGKKGNSRPRLKIYEKDHDAEAVPLSIWPAFEVGHNQEATKEVRKLGFENASQHSPKPVRLIERCINLVCEPNENALIMDPYAGTGTTGHATLSLNHRDGGNRQFILIEQGIPSDRYCRTLTAERVKKAIKENEFENTGYTFLKAGRKIDRQAIVSLERDALANLICQADETGRGKGIARLSGYKYIIGRNHRSEGICLVWNGQSNGEVTKAHLKEAAEEVTKAGLKRPFRIYGAYTRVGDTSSWKFCQIPDEILAQMHIQEDLEDAK